jgi:hypothetical protein
MRSKSYGIEYADCILSAEGAVPDFVLFAEFIGHSNLLVFAAQKI